MLTYLHQRKMYFRGRASVFRVMGSRIDPLSVDSLRYFSLHDWCNKGRGVCYPLCGMVDIKYHLLLIEKSNPCSGGSGFRLSSSHYLNGSLPYIRCHITVNKMC